MKKSSVLNSIFNATLAALFILALGTQATAGGINPGTETITIDPSMVELDGEESYGVLKRYKIELYSMRCLEEDDPGGEIEIYGKIKALILYSGSDPRISRRPQQKTIWYRSESRPFEMDEHETYYRKGYVVFYATDADIRNGKYRISLSPDLMEDDGSSRDDRFYVRSSHNCNQWDIHDGLNRQKTILFQEGDTRLQVKWLVKKL